MRALSSSGLIARPLEGASTQDCNRNISYGIWGIFQIQKNIFSNSKNFIFRFTLLANSYTPTHNQRDLLSHRHLLPEMQVFIVKGWRLLMFFQSVQRNAEILQFFLVIDRNV